jgi:hypothetical protein
MDWARWIGWGLGGLVVLGLGCSPQERKRGGAPTADESVGAGRAGSNIAAAAESDGPDPEALSDAVKGQLSLIGKALVSVDLEMLAASGTCGAAVAVTDTEAWRRVVVQAGPPLEVADWGPSGGEPSAEARGAVSVSPQAMAGRMRSLLGLDGGGGDASVSFKLFGLVRDGDSLRTRQRLTARGTVDGREVRSLVVADAMWSAPAGDTPPQLTGFRFANVTQSAWTTAPRRFEDATARILGETEAWREQLRLGMNTWVRRIDRTLKPDFLGYHGIAIGDVDGDDREDVYLCQPGGLPNLLFLQQANGTLKDISAAAGVDWLDNSTGALLVDLDNDGDKDLVVASHRALVVMENDGAGRFGLRARLDSIALGYSPTAADIDLDGDLDLLVLRYGADSREVGDFPTPHPFYDARNGGANVLLENQGGFRFDDVTAARGLDVDNHRFSFAASWEDYDNDGDADVYIANDFGPNQLFRNDHGRFVDVSAESGAEDWGFGMSATWGDYDRDGFMDLYVSNMFSGAGNQVVQRVDFNPLMPEETKAKYLKMVRGNSLLRNEGNGRFSDVTDPMAEGFGKWAWGAVWADLNNDGWEDIYLANGYLSQPDHDDL